MKFYGIDLHHDSMVIAIIDESNCISSIRIRFHTQAFENFVNSLVITDYVAVEASTNTFWFYGLIKDKVAECYVVNTWKFVDIVKGNKKTDKIDAKKLVKKLRYRVLCDGDEDDLPTVFVPIPEVQWLRSLFSTYNMLKKEKNMIVNRIYSLLIQYGYNFSKSDLFNKKLKNSILDLDLPEPISFQLRLLYNQHEFLENQFIKLKNKILLEGRIFEKEIDKLISMKGISVFIAIAIMTDIADIERFSSSKKFTSYLRTAPKISASNNSVKIGCINRQSRKLSLTLICQSLIHVYKSSDYLYDFYQSKRKGKKAGEARIAVARKAFTMIYQMLKNDKYYKWMDHIGYKRKTKEYNKFLEKRAA